MKSDASLQRGLLRGLRRAFPDPVDRIRVDVSAGVATLVGPVDRYSLKDAIEVCVRSSPGVAAVESELDVFVAQFSHRPDADIQRSAAGILARTTCLPPR